MIPESLRLRNFLSHRETDLDLRGVHLASLVGENGAGKSALLDAMTWAVWGRSRAPHGHDDDLVYHGESALEVEYLFRMPYQDGTEHRCRILRRRERRGRRSVRSVLDFEIETEGGWRILTADNIRETQRRIVDYLGLDYDTFINSAYLRQGHADEFTVQSPGQRKQVLSTVLGLDRWVEYQDRARVKLSAVQGQLKAVNRRLDETEAELARRPEFEAQFEQSEAEAAVADAALQQAQTEADELTRVREQASALRRRLDDLDRRYGEAERELAALASDQEAHQEQLTYYRRLVDRASEIESQYRAYQDARAEERAFGQKLSQAAQLQTERSGLEAQVAAARDALSVQLRALEREETRLERAVRDALTPLERELSDLRTQVALLSERFPGERAAEELQVTAARVAELDAATGELDGARAMLQQNEVEQSRLDERNRQLRDNMAEIKARLDALAESRADCPLCGQPLSPDHHQRVLAEIEAEGTVMGDEFRTNRATLADLGHAQQTSALRIEALTHRLRTRPVQESALARLQQQIEQGEVARERAAALEAQIGVINRRLESADYAHVERAALAQVVADKDVLQARLSSSDFAPEAHAALVRVRDALGELGYDAEAHAAVQRRIAALQDVEREYRELEKARVGLEGESAAIARGKAQITGLRTRSLQLANDRGEQMAVLTEIEPLRARTPVLTQQLTAARRRATAARQNVGAAKQNLAALLTLERRREGVREQRASMAKGVAILTELRDAFGVNGIPAMIIEHALPDLERDANRILQRLTGGRMHVRLETQRETKSGNLRETLDIIISDEKGTRPYEGFSGGEKFRINFAIRVALSRMLARRAGVGLRSLFVDEGFGSLDADGRQRLVEAVKAIQSDFDMILVITHIPELCEAFPTQIQVSKSDSGSQVEIV